MQLQNLVILTGILFMLYYFFVTKESFQGEVVDNAFTGLRCINDGNNEAKDDLPVYRFVEDKTFQCVSRDGTNCMYRKDMSIPDNRNCNEYLSKEGIRDIKSDSRAFFNEYESGSNTNLKLFTCTNDGLLNKNIWCGKLSDTFLNKCKDDKFHVTWDKQCTAVANYQKTDRTGSDYSIKTNDDIKASKVTQKTATDSARATGMASRTRQR